MTSLEIKLISPLRVLANKTQYKALNLNVYRNLHHFTNNTMKKVYKEMMQEQVEKLPQFKRISLTLTLYPKTKRMCDLSNVCCIIDKFISDTLVEMGKIEDDNYEFIPEVNYRMGKVDKLDPRCEVIIREI